MWCISINTMHAQRTGSFLSINKIHNTELYSTLDAHLTLIIIILVSYDDIEWGSSLSSFIYNASHR